MEMETEMENDDSTTTSRLSSSSDGDDDGDNESTTSTAYQDENDTVAATRNSIGEQQRERFENQVKEQRWSDMIDDLSWIETRIKSNYDEEETFENALYIGFDALVRNCAEGESCPHMAVFEKFVQVQPKLLGWESTTGRIPMHQLSLCKNIKVLKWMIYRNPTECLIVQYDYKGIQRRLNEQEQGYVSIIPPSALHMAIDADWVEAVDYLLHIINNDYFPPITSTKETFFQLKCYDDQTPLQWACRRSKNSIILKVLRAYPHAASIPASSSAGYTGSTLPLSATYLRGDFPLHHYRNINNISTIVSMKVLRELLEAYPKAIETKDEQGFLPLHHAVQDIDVSHEPIELFLDAYPEGAKVPNRSTGGCYPLEHLYGHEDMPPDLLDKLFSSSPVDAVISVTKQQVSLWDWDINYAPDDETNNGYSHNNISNPDDAFILERMQRLLNFENVLSRTIKKCLDHIFITTTDGCYKGTTNSHVHDLDKDREVFATGPSGKSFLSTLCFASVFFHPCDFAAVIKEITTKVAYYIYWHFSEREYFDEDKVMKILYNALMATTETNYRQVSFLHDLYSNNLISHSPQLVNVVLSGRNRDNNTSGSRDSKNTVCETCGSTADDVPKHQHSWLCSLQHYLPKDLLQAHAKFVDYQGYLPLHLLLVERPWMTMELKTQKTKKTTSPCKRARQEEKKEEVYPLAFAKRDVSTLLRLNPTSAIAPVQNAISSNNDSDDFDKKKNMVCLDESDDATDVIHLSGKDANKTDDDAEGVSKGILLPKNLYSGFSSFMLSAVKGKNRPCLDTTFELLQVFVAHRSLNKFRER